MNPKRHLNIQFKNVAQTLEIPEERTNTPINNRVTAYLVRPPCKPAYRTFFRHSALRFGYRETGFALIELIITIAIVAVLVALAEPSYSTFIEKRKITGGAEEIASFMMLARSEAVKHNQQTTVSFVRTGDTDWCIGMMFGAAACDCKETVDTEADYCALKYTENGGANVVEPHLISSGEYSGFKLTAATTASGDDQLTYDPVRGILANTADLSSFTVQSNNAAYELVANISATGTVKTCTTGTKKVSGFKTC